jgi:hypothetical protein
MTVIVLPDSVALPASPSMVIVYEEPEPPQLKLPPWVCPATEMLYVPEPPAAIFIVTAYGVAIVHVPTMEAVVGVEGSVVVPPLLPEPEVELPVLPA